MRLFRFAVGLAAALVVAAAVPASSLASSSPATGTGTIAPDITSSQPQGANTLLSGTATGTLGGTLDGAITESADILEHLDGNGVFFVEGTFAGTLGDCGPVNLRYRLILTGSLAGYSGEAGSENSGGPGYQIHITGNLSGFTYSGQYHC